MITINKKYRYPDQWEELSSEQYLMLIELLLEFMQGHISAQEVRLAYFLNIANINPRAIVKRNRERFHENLFRITRTLNFMFRYEYPDGSLDEIEPELRKSLAKTLPNDLPDHVELQYVKKLKRQTLPDFLFAKNLLPEIEISRKKYPGYIFELHDEIIHTTLTAEQYVNANLLYGKYIDMRNTSYLDTLVATLYCPKGSDAIAFAETTAKLDNVDKQAVFICFQAIQTFLATRTKYAILWNRKPAGKNDKLSLGLSDSIYSLSSAGYGSLSEVSQMPLTAFFDLLVKNIIDAVKTLRDMKMKKDEIAEKTGLSLAQINKII
jgi:ribosomal protein L32E